MKEVTVKQETSLTVPSVDDWGTPEIGAQDILIPKILLMQGLSQFVADGDAQIGEFRDSVSGTLLGSLTAPISFIPVHIDKTWVLSKKIGDRFKYQTMIPVTRDNENMEWEYTDNEGVLCRRDYTMICYCLLPSDVANGMPMPYTISFRRTSMRAGKKLFTQMYIRNKQAGLVPPAQVMELSAKREKNDQGTYMILDIAPKRSATAPEIVAAFELYKTIQGGSVRVDNSDLEQEVQAPASDAPLSNQF
jgi:hypothetical protein